MSKIDHYMAMGTQEQIEMLLDAIAANEGILQTEFYKLFPDSPAVRKDINHMLHDLAEDGYIRRERSGKTWLLYSK